MRVDIYITTRWHGNFANGSGEYGIILQVMQNGEPRTKEHYAGWSHLPYQKLAVRAVTDAMQCMTAPCDVVIHTDNVYVESIINSGKSGGKYIELWESFFDAAKEMTSITVVREKRHEYASYIKQELARGKFITIEDR